MATTPITELDFAGIKNQLKTYLKIGLYLETLYLKIVGTTNPQLMRYMLLLPN